MIKRLNCLSLFAVLAVLFCGTVLAAEPQTVTLKDWTGRGFPPDLVNYTIDADRAPAASLRVIDAEGRSLPVQVTPGPDGRATLSFVAEIAPGGTSTYTVRTDGQAPAAALDSARNTACGCSSRPPAPRSGRN